jgi:exonuclease III
MNFFSYFHQFFGKSKVAADRKKRIEIAKSHRWNLKLLSYNIDGLNDFQVQFRTSLILGMIVSENPDVIHLQEVIPETYQYLSNALAQNGYQSSPPEQFPYFTATFVKTTSFNTITFDTVDFVDKARSRQGRNIRQLKAAINGLELMFLNCHLESTGKAFKSPESSARIHQLEQALDLLVKHPSGGMLSGDLNIRNPEASFVLKEFKTNRRSDIDIMDVAMQLEGSQLSYTWSRPSEEGGYSARYDRIYIVPSSMLVKFEPVSYKLIGGDDLFSLDEGAPYTTPSDHRGLVMSFHVISLQNSPDSLSNQESVASNTMSEPKKKKRSKEENLLGDDSRHSDNQKLKKSKSNGEIIDLT